MKVRNKKTGEIYELDAFHNDNGDLCCFEIVDEKNNTVKTYANLIELNEEWEGYEEPEEYWYIDYNGVVKCFQYLDYDWQKEMQAIGNYFESREEGEKALEKLKALTRLKDEGMEIYSFEKRKTGIDLDFYTLTILAPRDKDSLDLLFGGKE